jgi:hypothetical protein
MSNHEQTINENHFDDWLLSAILISIIVTMIMAYAASSGSELDTAFEIIAWLNSLVIFGAVTLLLGYIRLGAVLIIIGGISMVPIGIVGIMSGMRILERHNYNKYLYLKMEEYAAVNSIDLSANAQTEQPDSHYFPGVDKPAETPLYELKAEHFGPILPIGIVMASAGFFLMFLEVMRADTIFGFGIMGILMAFVTNSSKIRLYENRLELKLPIHDWRSIAYQDILQMGSPSDRGMQMKYKIFEGDKTVVFNSSIWGRYNVNKIYDTISLRVDRSILSPFAKTRYVPVKTQLISVEQDADAGVQDRRAYQIITQWTAPSSGKTHTFRSDTLWFDPQAYLQSDVITVHVDLQDPANYRIDTSFLPDCP